MRQALWPLVLAIFAGTRGSNREPVLIALLIGAGLGLIGLVGPAIGYLFTTYVIRDDSLIVNSGWLWKKTRIIPLARIQNVNLRQNMLNRLLGATAVMVETAAGKGVEAELSAVAMDDAIQLQQALMQRTVPTSLDEPIREPVIYQLTPRQLFWAGALNNRFFYIIAGLAGASQFGEIAEDLFKPIFGLLEKLSPVQAAMLATASFFGMILLGWLFSVIYSFSRFYGFRMVLHEKGLKIRYGLFTKIENIVPIGRVQSMRIGQPLLYRWFDFCEIFADTAGSFDAKELGGANKLCPITELTEIDKIGHIVFPEFRFSAFDWQLISPRAVYRFFVSDVIRFFGFCAPLVFLYFVLNSKSDLGKSISLDRLAVIGGIIFLFWIIGSFILANLKFKARGYSVQKGFVASKHGFWRRDVVIMPIDRTQMISVDQSLFQRRWKLADLHIYSSSPLGIVKIENLDLERALELQEQLVLDGSQRRNSWAGGN